MPFLVIIALLVSPGFGWVAWSRLQHGRTLAGAARVALGAWLGLGLPVLLGAASGWSLRGVDADLALILLAYVAFGVCAAAAWSLRSAFLRWTLGLAGIAVQCAALVVGGFAALLVDGEPQQQGSLAQGVRYRIDGLGNATTAEHGARVRILSSPSWAPFLEHELFAATYDGRRVKLDGLAVVRGDEAGAPSFQVRTADGVLASVQGR